LNNALSHKAWDVVSSLKLTIVCLAALMVLVVACTLAQVSLGTWGAVEVYMRRWLVWYDLPRSTLSIPVFPGGALVGAVLMVNLAAAQIRRLELSWKKSGLWIVHVGLILLFVGEFITGVYQVDTRLVFEEGQTTNFVESSREHELALIDVTDPAKDEVYGVPDKLLGRADTIPIPGTPIVLNVKKYFHNANLSGLGPGDGPALATAGVGTGVKVVELPPVSHDDDVNRTSALVEPVAGGRSYGTWLVSTVLGAPQSFTHEGRTYRLEMRSRRWYLPYSLTLKDFKHDVYPGTDIPKNFSSLVQLRDPGRGEDREVLIYMNQPLRYAGKAFYQASFGKGDTLSILQVVENPGWLLPYISTVLVGVGLIVHFGIGLRRAFNKRRVVAQQEVTA
jgi:hypothetical protein